MKTVEQDNVNEALNIKVKKTYLLGELCFLDFLDLDLDRDDLQIRPNINKNEVREC